MSTEVFRVLNIPKKMEINVKSPIECFRSMGLLDPNVREDSDLDVALANVLDKDAIATAKIWTNVGGVNVACLEEAILIHPNGDVEGPSDRMDLQRAPLSFCRTIDLREGGVDVMTLIAINTISHVADVCVYDPKRTAKEEKLYSIAGSVGNWLRVLLGEGWGMRVEVYCNLYSPSEAPDMKNLWLLLMVMLKAYMPHVRMVDTQAAMRLECLSNHTSMREVLTTIVHNINSLISHHHHQQQQQQQ
jgi:hypothetical protein